MKDARHVGQCEVGSRDRQERHVEWPHGRHNACLLCVANWKGSLQMEHSFKAAIVCIQLDDGPVEHERIDDQRVT